MLEGFIEKNYLINKIYNYIREKKFLERKI